MGTGLELNGNPGCGVVIGEDVRDSPMIRLHVIRLHA